MPPAGLVMKQPCFVSLSHHATCPPSPALRHQSLFHSDTFAVSGGITVTDYRALVVYPFFGLSTLKTEEGNQQTAELSTAKKKKC